KPSRARRPEVFRVMKLNPAHAPCMRSSAGLPLPTRLEIAMKSPPRTPGEAPAREPGRMPPREVPPRSQRDPRRAPGRDPPPASGERPPPDPPTGPERDGEVQGH